MQTDRELPDYSNPPLDEVVFGVQFSPPKNFTSLDLGAIYEPFRTDFPKVEEKPRLDVQVETFGGVRLEPENPFTIGPAPVRGRIWFISRDDSHLIQFQDNRFLLNWRRRADGAAYPRFAGVLEAFLDGLESVQEIFLERFSTSLKVNQAELTYVNLIKVNSFAEASSWIKVPGFPDANMESVNFGFGEVVSDSDEKPYARFTTEVQSVVARETEQKALRLTLSFRGQPPGKSPTDCPNFFEKGHDKIVLRFDELTTDKAHLIWGKHT